jgi:hypothetical protein
VACGSTCRQTATSSSTRRTTKPVWASNTDSPGAHLAIQDDRNIVIYAADGSVAWSPNTYAEDSE